MKRLIRVGVDFDGVVAYNPLRIVRPIIAFVKKRILGIRKLDFFYPTKSWQQFLWILIHESSIFPALGTKLLKNMVKEKKIEAHLITARYSFLDDHLKLWLKKNKLEKFFKSVNMNVNNEQPHIFKEKMLIKYKLEYFIEDNWDIVNYLNKKSKTRIYWIYNIFDRWVDYRHKFPFLKSALEAVK